MRRTRIVATLGPSTDDPAVLDTIIKAGVNVVRLNAAHSGPGELAGRLRAARESAARCGVEIGVLVDLPGPKIRVGDVEEGVFLSPGEPFRLLSQECVGDSSHACITYENFAEDVHPGDRILIDDGRIELTVEGVSTGEVVARVRTGGPLSSNKGVNVPGVTLSVDAITRYDRTVVQWAMANDIDFVGQSFVRSARDVEALREYMTTRLIPIVAKIEKHEATQDIEGIVRAADAVMVARGDLAVETAPERVPVLQRQIMRTAREAGKPCIVATEMLDSMRERTRPTRAEASDVANAIFARADAVMLSGESAVGKYPVEAVGTMGRIIDAAEDAALPARPLAAMGSGDDVQNAVSAAVQELASDLELAAIVTITQGGATARSVSRYRPNSKIIAATPKIETARKMCLVWGVETVVTHFAEEAGQLLDEVSAAVREQGLVQAGERIALTAGLHARRPGHTDFIHVRTV